MKASPQSYIDKELNFGAHNYSSLPVVLTSAVGSTLRDVQGAEYIDMMSAYSAASLGHAHPKILQTLVSQASSLAVTSRAFFNDKLPLLLEKLCFITSLDKAIVMNSGAEAVETALKFARKWGEMKKKIKKNKCEIIVCRNNFHGRTIGIISFSSQSQYKKNFGPFLPGFKEVEFGSIESLEKAITKNTCAFLVEPIQGEAGIITPSAQYLAKVRQLCTKHNVLLICDEIQTGLSRTGKLFCYEHSLIQPDLLILGKALGGGVYPVSAVVGRAEVMDLIKPGDHGSTFGGNALASAIALSSIELLSDPELIKRVEHLGKWSMQYLQRVLSPHLISGQVREVRGRGLFIAVELNFKAGDVVKEMINGGVLTKDTHENTIRLAPALTITQQELKRAYNCLASSIAKCSV